MNFRQLTKVSATTTAIATTIAIALISGVNSRDLNSVQIDRVNQTKQAPPSIVAQSSVKEIMNGVFEKAEAPTSGNAKIVEENGVNYLVIDSSFSTTDQAPDLQVLLDTAEVPPQKYEGSEAGRYINLGGIQNVMGEQVYPIPNAVDVSEISSAVIWCRMANATIGYATLNNSSTASSK